MHKAIIEGFDAGYEGLARGAYEIADGRPFLTVGVSSEAGASLSGFQGDTARAVTCVSWRGCQKFFLSVQRAIFLKIYIKQYFVEDLEK